MSIRFTRLSDAKRGNQAGDRSGTAASGLTNSEPRTNVSRLLSITSIIVALTVAGSLAIENVMRRMARTPEMTPVLSAEKSKPAPVTTPIAAPVKTDETRMKFMERRLTLLERQIIMLQTQSTEGQQKQVSIENKVSALESRLDADRQVVDTQVMSQAPVEKTTPKPSPPTENQAAQSGDELEQLTRMHPPRPASTPVQPVMAKAPEPVLPAPQNNAMDTIVTGSIKPAASSTPINAADNDLAKLVKPEVRNANTQEVVQTRFALSLNLHDHVGDVRDAWDQLSTKHGDLLDRLEPRALPQGTQEGVLMYRLIVGPVSNAAEAANRCAKLRTRGIKCTASVFGGEHLVSPPSPGTLIKVKVVAANDTTPLRVSTNLKALIANPPIPRAKPTR